MAKNVLNKPLIVCSADPVTGAFRNGKCDTCAADRGMHTICVRVTADFLEFSREQGNDLSTPMPEYAFPGLQPGDYWCLCLARWVEAHQAGMAPSVKLEATHASVLEFVELACLREYAI